jgi:Ran GTPase-activating protein (RanGAP) involved in mRNA processing and transport
MKVDDYECKRIVDALLENVTLEELVLSRNLIGSSENLSMVKPNHITGGEAFAKLLASENCNLKTLNIDWNMIRLHSASVFCDSVGMNKSLVNLDLSYNKIANDGGTTLGRALLNNLTLKNLNVAHNGIGAAACLTIAAGEILASK